MADVDRWDPGQIDEVADALVERARHSRTAGDEIGDAHTSADWRGERPVTPPNNPGTRQRPGSTPTPKMTC